MGEYVVLHDGVLIDTAGARSNVTTIKTDGSIPLRQVFYAIREAARAGSGRLHTVFVLCRAFTDSNTHIPVAMDAEEEGLLLGSETVLSSNVAMWSAIQNMTANIVIYACAGATEPSRSEDGKYLLRAL